MLDARALALLTDQERAELDRLLLLNAPLWQPLPGPQTLAYRSGATIIGFGGAAGGGKTDFAIGKALTQHRKVAIFRRNGTELTAIIDRLGEVIGTKDGYNAQERIWRIKPSLLGAPAGRQNGTGYVQIEFGSVPDPGDERKYQGRPHDLLVFDEASNFLETQVRFLLGWLRSTHPEQKQQAVLAFNPPTSAEGRWIIDFFAPWLDPNHPCPAEPGEIRWFAMMDGKEVEVVDGRPFTHKGELIKPQSRTFIPSRISDNPFLMKTGYMAQLQSLPEPLRSQMLYGDFMAGMEDDPFQVIPTRWVDAAMARWEACTGKLPEMQSVGVDVSRGGRDDTVIMTRHDWTSRPGPDAGFFARQALLRWFAPPITYTAQQCQDGPTVAGYVIARRHDSAPVHIDAVGVGSSPYDWLTQNNVQTVGVVMSEKSHATDKSGRLKFANIRSQIWWQMREALDPANPIPTALPPDKRLKMELCAPRWKLAANGIQVMSREEIIDKIGRSPDMATACCLANMDTPKMTAVMSTASQKATRTYDPYDRAHLRR